MDGEHDAPERRSGGAGEAAAGIRACGDGGTADGVLKGGDGVRHRQEGAPTFFPSRVPFVKSPAEIFCDSN